MGTANRPAAPLRTIVRRRPRIRALNYCYYFISGKESPFRRLENDLIKKVKMGGLEAGERKDRVFPGGC